MLISNHVVSERRKQKQNKNTQKKRLNGLNGNTKFNLTLQLRAGSCTSPVPFLLRKGIMFEKS